ncbi:MAG: AbrB/MazE/SpoVT family DNA-binding domain-containing protein [Bacteroidetes bacterium]|nr:AbrB/MazE/SpoVT family DNA-binding domain-containing protein [Bacteroidota bacterium]
MKAKVIKIGNSRGIRIPRHILEESGLRSEVEVEIEIKDRRIILKPTSKVRDGWESAFQRMSKNSDDVLLDKNSLESSNFWDKEEWEW